MNGPTDLDAFSPVAAVVGAGVSVELDAASGIATATDGARIPLTLPQAAPPPGYPFTESPYGSTALTFGPAGFVAVGTGSFRQSAGISGRTVGAAVWFSADGLSWQSIDVSPSLGDQAASLQDVVATGEGYLAVGAVGRSGIAGAPAQPLVLRSTDGVTWERAGAPATTWSSRLEKVLMLHDAVVLRGSELICDTDGGYLGLTRFFGRQERVWTSPDGGLSWAQVDLTASGAVKATTPLPTDASPCTGTAAGAPGDSRYDDAVRSIAATADHLVVWSGSGDTIAVTSDLTTWTTATLEQAAATSNGSTGVEAPRATLVTEHAGMLTALSLENRRNDDGTQNPSQFRTFVWTSGDAGASWELQRTHGRPLALGAASRLTETDDGAIVATTTDPFRETGGLQFLSQTGAANDNLTCIPVAAADCFGLQLRDASLSGIDLSGIDFRNASLRDVDLAGAKLTGARFGGSLGTRLVLTDADLSNASFVKANMLSVDFASAVVAGASFGGSYVSATLLAADRPATATLAGVSVIADETQPAGDVDLSGLDLRGLRLTGSSLRTTPWKVVLHAAGADLTGSFFSNVDLTGSDLASTNLTEVSFAHVLCPDGLPADANAFGSTACRL